MRHLFSETLLRKNPSGCLARSVKKSVVRCIGTSSRGLDYPTDKIRKWLLRRDGRPNSSPEASQRTFPAGREIAPLRSGSYAAMGGWANTADEQQLELITEEHVPFAVLEDHSS